jgi:hypothetical protein
MSEIEMLDQLAREINVRLAKASEITQHADEKVALEREQALDHRLAAALRLKEARDIVDDVDSGMSWAAWCREHIDASRSEIKRLLKIAGSPKPAAVLDAERAAAREGMRQLRNRRREGSNIAAVRAKPHDEGAATRTGEPLDEIKAAIRELTAGDLEQFKAWFREYCSALPDEVDPGSPTRIAPEPPAVCHAPNGECRYGGCAAASRCLAARKAA